MQYDWPLSRDLVLIGGGHTHALVLRKWGMTPLAGVRVTLINPGPTSPYTGMLPGHIAGHYDRHELDIDLVRLARFSGARIIFDKACGLDKDAKLIHLEGRAPVHYDVASIDIGVTANLADIEGFVAHAHSVKPLGTFAKAWLDFLNCDALHNDKAQCIIIGGGIAGIELALAMAHRLEREGVRRSSVTLLEVQREILADTGARTRKVLLRALSHYKVRVLTGVRVAKITAGTVELSDRTSLAANFVASAAGARPHPWTSATGLSCTNGFINVGPDLRAISDTDIFAVGDCAHLTHAPRPKAGVFAVREAPVLFDNLRAALSGGKFRDYRPQTDYLKLISTGDKSVVGQKFFFAISGRPAWKLKDHIDKKFMAQFHDFPAMALQPKPQNSALDDEANESAQPLCGGCGSKVSRNSLASALAGRPIASRSDTRTGIGDDAAVLSIRGQLQVISTDHLRAFIEDPYLLAKITAVHALGDIWAKGARPQSALLSLIIPRMSERMQATTVTEVVSAVSEVLREEGADLVGGHTSMGTELTVGLTVTGLLEHPAIGLDRAAPGDVIILTKPIGTGVILAGEMRGLAEGRNVEHALNSMQQPLATASKLLTPVAHAMTDVTGFGLAGHLMRILHESNVSARISIADLPILPGAEQLSARGVRSSIWLSNTRLDHPVTRPISSVSDLIHDPQTAGGLLAAVPADEVPALTSAFRACGEHVFLIGTIEYGPPGIVVS